MSVGAVNNTAVKNRIDYLDFVKGLAIISVVLLHTLPSGWLKPIFAVFHIWQAVPVFIFVAGITGCITWERRKKNISAYYKDLPSKIWGLYLPYIIAVLLYQLYVFDFMNPFHFVTSILSGSVGPGGYFVSLIVQHMLIFPFILMLRDKLGNDNKFLLACLFISFLLEWLFVSACAADPNADNMFYRFFYGRYLFVAALGATFYNNQSLFSAFKLRVLSGISIVYIILTLYFGISLSFIPNEWNPQHYPSYFYTYLLVAWLVKNKNKVSDSLHHIISKFGKNSYDIFITQLFIFSTFGVSMRHGFFTALLLPFICLYGGLLVAYLKKKYTLI
ncbi:acyltransferase family protein [Desulfovibrio litoralis]|uniref:Peptidoglycan/LPS O-acetylase OafA/YrhL, contains acyltransferase and SGNH-hydrolase domains n=1 Tax=Desulfovibrio litoralis DSM 11393 TaxID=1121455 RepID=A0A1M7SWZ1_9BACT|nr:acyltransferase [Desulfovibrio litoralis]SHN62992.1 Peptidoglycan/LPS O-acetylase OafA/YrhL, contains acyltransferase and SGNH-hydrolase domains [Desulfovibrio litoralis DSM 11393]